MPDDQFEKLIAPIRPLPTIHLVTDAIPIVQQVPVPDLPVSDDSVGMGSIIFMWIRQHMIDTILQQRQGSTSMDSSPNTSPITSAIAKIILMFLVTVGGGVLGSLGISQQSMVEIAGAAAALLLGLFGFIVHHFGGLFSHPPTIAGPPPAKPAAAPFPLSAPGGQQQ